MRDGDRMEGNALGSPWLKGLLGLMEAAADSGLGNRHICANGSLVLLYNTRPSNRTSCPSSARRARCGADGGLSAGSVNCGPRKAGLWPDKVEAMARAWAREEPSRSRGAEFREVSTGPEHPLCCVFCRGREIATNRVAVSTAISYLPAVQVPRPACPQGCAGIRRGQVSAPRPGLGENPLPSSFTWLSECRFLQV